PLLYLIPRHPRFTLFPYTTLFRSPDVCLLSLKSVSNRMRATAEIVARVPSVAVIILTNRPDEDEFMAAMRGGAAGYLPQSLDPRSEEHTSELQSQSNLVCRLLLEK